MPETPKHEIPPSNKSALKNYQLIVSLLGTKREGYNPHAQKEMSDLLKTHGVIRYLYYNNLDLFLLKDAAGDYELLKIDQSDKKVPLRRNGVTDAGSDQKTWEKLLDIESIPDELGSLAQEVNENIA